MANRDSKIMPKLEWHLIPWDVLPEVVEVLMGEVLEDGTKTGGKAKYGANNWRTPPYFKPEDVYDSLQRHTNAMFFKSEEFDPLSGKRHAAHIVANALFALYYETYGLWDVQNSEIIWNGAPGTDEDTLVESEAPASDVGSPLIKGEIAEQLASLTPEQRQRLRQDLVAEYAKRHSTPALQPPSPVDSDNAAIPTSARPWLSELLDS